MKKKALLTSIVAISVIALIAGIVLWTAPDNGAETITSSPEAVVQEQVDENKTEVVPTTEPEKAPVTDNNAETADENQEPANETPDVVEVEAVEDAKTDNYQSSVNTTPVPEVDITNTLTGNSNGNGKTFVIDDRSQSKEEAVEAQKNPLDGRNVYFAGYANATINKYSTITLENLPDNDDFLIAYTITDKKTGDVVFETNLIRSGQCVAWLPGETLEAGVYNLQILQSPYYPLSEGNFIPLTAGSTDVTITIVE